ncbi:MAG: AAA family ATPase, partial [Acidobacteriota bacterium]
MATETMPQAPVTPSKGRENELARLLERWELARDGEGQLVQLRAEAGLGKSLLVRRLAESTASESRAFLLGRCTARDRQTAFAPLHDLLWRLENETQHSPAEPDDATPPPDLRLRATLVARLRTLLATTAPVRTTALNLNPEGQARKTLESLSDLFLESAKRLPILLVIEDLDWIDPSSLELLKLLAHRKPNVQLMVVLTFSPGFEPAWDHRPHLSLLELERLTPEQQDELLDRLTVRGPLSLEARREILALSGGVPLFLEELVQLARVSGAASADGPSGPDTADPATTFGRSVAQRIEHLGDVGELAQQASVLGAELAQEHLAQLSDFDEAALHEALDRLIDSDILHRREARGTDLAFRHALLHAAVRETLPEATLREAHRRSVNVLNESFPDFASANPGRMAEHYAAAGMTAEAAGAWRAAAEQSISHAAHLEAAACARRGLEQVESHPESDVPSKEEIALRIALGAALGTAKGYADSDAQAAYDQALELAWQEPPTLDLFTELQEMASFYLARGHVHTALAIAERAMGLIEHREETEILSTGRRTLGFAQMLRGQFTDADKSLQQSQAPYSVHRSLMQATPPAIGIPLAESLSHRALTQWFLGYPSQALKHGTDSLTLAKRFNDPFTRVFTIHRACFLHVFRREPIPTRELAHELVELANRHGFLFFIAAGMFLEGQALTAQGRAAEGLQMMSGGLDGVWASGMEVGRPRNLALLAEACGRSELVEQGLSLIKEGIAAVEITGEAHYEPELYRIQGELLQQQGAPEEEIEESHLQALAVARHHNARSLELRAAVGLGRLWRSRDKVRQARELLASV